MTKPLPACLRLSQAHPEHAYQIVAIDGPAHIEQRLIALGFVRGRLVQLVNRTLGRQTLAVCVDGTGVLLRAEEAAGIAVSSHPDSASGRPEA